MEKQLNDKKLIQNIKLGKESSFRVLFMKYGKKLYNFSRKNNLSHEDAEGIVQEVFAKIWETRNGLDENLSLNAYILTIAQNLIFNKARKQVNRRVYEEYFKIYTPHKTNNNEEQIFYNELEGIILKFVDKLAPRTMQVFKLNRMDGFSNQEIAEKLNVSKKTVENQMNSALKQIRKAIIESNSLNVIGVLSSLCFLLVRDAFVIS